MIQRDELIPVGKFTRPHGVRGEMSLLLSGDVFEDSAGECVVCAMDGIFVPFFIEEYRYKTDNVVLVKFEKIDTVEQARMFTNKEAYVLKRDCDGGQADFTWADFIGFSAEDTVKGSLGSIAYVDDSTLNVLFVVERPDGSELFIPAQEVFIEEIDYDNQHLLFNLPEGLVD